MKKTIWLAAFSLVFLMSANAMALEGYNGPGEGVLGSVHDMRIAAGAVDSGGNDRVCSFCHTPHHGYLDPDPNAYYPLWSRELDTQTFAPYISPTMNASDWYFADIAIGPTRLCMSCHDGSIAPDQHYNFPGIVAPLVADGWGNPGIGAGQHKLLDDHPIGFNYSEIAIGPSVGDPSLVFVTGRKAHEDPWIREAGSGVLVYEGNPFGLRVVDRLYQGQYMTCATCHDVHNKMNADMADHPNYLVLSPQRDSALCLTCHIK